MRHIVAVTTEATADRLRSILEHSTVREALETAVGGCVSLQLMAHKRGLRKRSDTIPGRYEIVSAYLHNQTEEAWDLLVDRVSRPASTVWTLYVHQPYGLSETYVFSDEHKALAAAGQLLKDAMNRLPELQQEQHAAIRRQIRRLVKDGKTHIALCQWDQYSEEHGLDELSLSLDAVRLDPKPRLYLPRSKP